jgi:hypothetical protein
LAVTAGNTGDAGPVADLLADLIAPVDTGLDRRLAGRRPPWAVYGDSPSPAPGKSRCRGIDIEPKVQAPTWLAGTHRCIGPNPERYRFTCAPLPEDL